MVKLEDVTFAVYGWVQNISPDLTSAEPLNDGIVAAEGEELTLTLYFTKNDPVNGDLFIFRIATSGSAVGMFSLTIIMNIHGVYYSE